MKGRNVFLWSLSIVFAVVTASIDGGLQLPDIQHVNGVELKRNGQGIRSISMLGMTYEVYIAGFYSASPILTEKDALDSLDSPMQLDFTFLKHFRRGQVKKAWEMQMDYSISYRYDGYKKDCKNFIEMLTNTIEKGGVQTVQFIGDDTIVIDQGEYKGLITGKEFQKAFLSMWFGEKAVAEDLKVKLLDGSLHRTSDAFIV